MGKRKRQRVSALVLVFVLVCSLIHPIFAEDLPSEPSVVSEEIRETTPESEATSTDTDDDLTGSEEEEVTEEPGIAEEDVIPAEEPALETEGASAKDANASSAENVGADRSVRTLTWTDSEYTITATFDESAGLPDGTELSVSPITSTEKKYQKYYKEASDRLGWDTGAVSRVHLLDIKLKKNGKTVQPKGPVSVEIALLAVGGVISEDDAKTQVVHFGSEKEIMDTEVTERSVIFDTESFSVYAVVEGDPTTPATHSTKYEFYDKNGDPFLFENGNGDETYVQYVKDGETLMYPGTPTGNLSEPEKEFFGWYRKTSDGRWGAKAVFDTPITSEDDVVPLYARYEKTYYVTYYDEFGNVYSVVKHEKDASIRTDVSGTETPYTAASSYSAFLGWASEEGLTEEVPEGTTMTVDGNLSLYPVVDRVKWINFVSGETGNGATYTAPVYVLGTTVEASKKPDDPVRTGYTFQGWYKDEACTQPFVWDGTEVIESDITLYAKWREASTHYSVVIWKQNVEGTGYDYVESVPYTATTGTTVTAGSAETGRSYEGFSYNAAKSTTEAVVLADGSTALMVYYDRNLYTLTFQVNGAYVPTNDTSGTLYGYVNGEYVELKRNGNTYTAATGNYVYTPTTSNSGTQYGLVDGEYIKLTYYSRASYGMNPQPKGWYYGGTMLSRGTQYTGTRYTREEETVNYTGQRYKYQSGWATVRTITAPFETPIAEYFPITDENGFVYDGYQWSDYNGIRYQYVMQSLESVPSADVVFHGTKSSTVKRIEYYTEVSDMTPSDAETVTFNGKEYVLYKLVTHNFNFITYEEEFHPIDGYVRDRSHASPAFGSNNRASIGPNNINRLYYDLDSYHLEFRDSFDTNTVYDDKTVKFETSLDRVVIDAPEAPEGYYFHGWYADPECTTRVFFHEPTEEDLASLKYDINASGRKTYKSDGEDGADDYIVLANMPASNYALYANWAPLRYQVNIDPNGGELMRDGSQATYFTCDYGEKIGEYANITRRYVRIAEGQDTEGLTRYSYHVDTRYDNDGVHRWAYYYEDPEGDYIYDPDAYTFAGWYKVTQNGAGPLERTSYNFDMIVSENTTLRALWRREGVFKVKYTNVMNEGKEGQLTSPDPKPVDDSYTYVDLSEVRVGQPIEPPANCRFAGWRIKGSGGPVYQPGDVCVIDSNFAEFEEDGTIYITFEPVFISLPDTCLRYDVNTPSGGELLSNELADTPDNAAEELLNKNTVDLSTGEGFTVRGYRMIGWSDVPIDPAEYEITRTEDTFTGDLPNGAHLFLPGGTYGISGDDNTLYAVWELIKTPFRFTKNGENDDGSESPLAGAEFAFYADKDLQIPLASRYPQLNQNAVSTEDAADNVSYELPLGVWYMKELSAPEPYEIDQAVHVISVQDAGDGTCVVTIDGTEDPLVVVNYKHGTDILFRKTDAATGESLEDASFIRRKEKQNNELSSPSAFTIKDQSGMHMSFTPGTYHLEETEAPEGYYASEAEAILTVTDTREVRISGNPSYVLTWESGNPVITVSNTKAVSLTIEKEVQGNMGSKTRRFAFAVTDAAKADGSELTGTYPYRIESENGIREEGTVTVRNGAFVVKKEGSATESTALTISHGEHVTVRNLPEGIALKVTEEDTDESYLVSCSACNTESGTAYGNSVCEVSSDGKQAMIAAVPSGGITLHYTNTLSFAVPTRADSRPSRLAPLFMILPFVWIMCERRKRRQREKKLAHTSRHNA